MGQMISEIKQPNVLPNYGIMVQARGINNDSMGAYEEINWRMNTNERNAARNL